MRARRLLPILALAGGCASAAFHSQTGVTPPAVTVRAVVVAGDDAALVAARGQRLGSIDVTGNASENQDDLAVQAADEAAYKGGTHVVAGDAGTATRTWIDPATRTRTCSRDGDTRTCQTTWTPATTDSASTPYARYDVYRVEPEAWPELPAQDRPAAIAAARLTPIGADGSGVAIGWFTQAYPGARSGTSGFVFPTAYTADASQVDGMWLSSSQVRGSTVVAIDLGLGGGSFSGTAAATTATGSGTARYTTTYGGAALALRVGEQVAWQKVALSAGAGVGGALWIGMPSIDPGGYAFVEPPRGPAGDLYFPLWAALTIKPSCDWGVQALASYDVRPLETSTSAPSLAVGLLWQPASACF